MTSSFKIYSSFLAISALLFLAPAMAEPNGLKLRSELDQPVLLKNDKKQKVILKVEVEGVKPALAAEKEDDRARLNVSVVLDQSGSMSGTKIAQAREAAQIVVDQMSGTDIFSLVTYESKVEVPIPAAPIAKNRVKYRRSIQAIQSGGSTALYEGVETGAEQVSESYDEANLNRVILLSDGQANVGPSSSDEISELGKRFATKGISVTTVGLGSAYNEDLMTALAEASDANYYYVENASNLAGVFEDELGELKNITARDIKLKVGFADGVKPLRVLGRNKSVTGQQHEVAFKTLADEQVRELFFEMEVDPAGDLESREVATVTVDYVYEFADSARESETQTISLKYSDSKEEVEKSRNAEISADAEIWSSADLTAKAIKYADSGDQKTFTSLVDGQIYKLKELQKTAPDSKKRVIQEEINDLERAKATSSSRGLNKSSRKSLLQRIYGRSNSKTR